MPLKINLGANAPRINLGANAPKINLGGKTPQKRMEPYIKYFIPSNKKKSNFA